jgi:integrase/recombinase XerD
VSWCHQHHRRLFQARRADIECFARGLEARGLEARGRARATITRRLCIIAGFYRYAVEEDLLDHSPAAHVRRPRLDYESHATGLDRNELGALLVSAGHRSSSWSARDSDDLVDSVGLAEHAEHEVGDVGA